MVKFHYKARDKASVLQEGDMDADSVATVAGRLKQTGLLPVEIKLLGMEHRLDNLFSGLRRVKSSDINMLTRQLFVLEKAGIPLLSSLRAVREQVTSKELKALLDQVAKDIEAGATFSSALERHPQVFGQIYVSLVRAGEVSGRLSEILERLAYLGEHEEKVRNRINAALRYPMIVVVSILIAFCILITAVVPRFVNLYSQFNAALPLPTRILLGINTLLTKYWWLLLILAGIAFFLVRNFITTPKGRLFWDYWKLKVPVFGPLVHKLIMSRFTRLVGTLVKSGIPIMQVLDLVSLSLGNAVLTQSIEVIKHSVNEGKGITGPMRASGMFPAVVLQMVATGEETGKLDELLMFVSDYMDMEIDITIANLIVLIEPVLILFLGLSVLFMALGIFMPIWGMMNLFRSH